MFLNDILRYKAILVAAAVLCIGARVDAAHAQDRLKIGLYGGKTEKPGGGLVISGTGSTYQQFGAYPSGGGLGVGSFINGWTSCFGDGFGICTEVYTVPAVDEKMSAATQQVNKDLATLRSEVLAAVAQPGGDTVMGLKGQVDALREELQLLRQEMNELKLGK